MEKKCELSLDFRSAKLKIYGNYKGATLWTVPTQRSSSEAINQSGCDIQ